VDRAGGTSSTYLACVCFYVWSEMILLLQFFASAPRPMDVENDVHGGDVEEELGAQHGYLRETGSTCGCAVRRRLA